MKLDAIETKDNYLVIELPQFDFPLVYSEKEYELPETTFTIDIIPTPAAAGGSSSLSSFSSGFPSSSSAPVVVKDLELFRDNPIENKHRKLARSHRNGPLDRDLKPNAKIRDELNVKFQLLFVALASKN
jgi:phosphatidylinositol 3-kinase